ncbi:MAG TPA: hypothetical protein VIQ74_03135 [Gemmatimonadaceae bacterium]
MKGRLHYPVRGDGTQGRGTYGASSGSERRELAITVTGRLRDDQEPNIHSTTVQRLVGDSGSNLESDTGIECVHGALDLQVEPTREHVEKLSRACVTVTDLDGIGRHSLLDDAQVVGAYEVPSVTLVTP